MPWFKVDDSLESHPKIKAIPRPRRLKAMGLWVLAGSWSASQLTDGFIPNYMLSELSATKREATTLVEVGLWTATEGGYVFKDWHDWQPTRAKVEADRDAAKERMRVARERKKAGSSGNVRANTSATPPNGSGEVRSTPRSLTPTRPDPTRPDPSSSSSGTSDAGSSKTRETQLPASWQPTDEHKKRAADTGLDLEHQATKFRLHAEENARKAVNWNSAFTRWLMTAAEWDRRRNTRPAAPVRPHVSTLEAAPSGMTDEEYDAWEAAQYAKRRQA